MKRTVVEKFYIMFNLVAQKQYVGRTRNLDARYSDHVNKLRAGRHENPELQRDWDRDGEESFIWVDVILRAGDIRANLMEDLLIDTLNTLDPAYGYNRMTSRGWGPHAKLRDLERKLIQHRKFKLIPGACLDDPIAAGYLESVWKGHGRVKAEEPEEMEDEEEFDECEDGEEDGAADDPVFVPDQSITEEPPEPHDERAGEGRTSDDETPSQV